MDTTISSTKYKCCMCSKKIPFYLTEAKTCRCGRLTCSAHLDDHPCTHDFKEEFITDNAETIAVAKIMQRKIDTI